MASRGEQGCCKALNGPKNMSLGRCAECWSALAELQARNLHTALLHVHSYSDISRNARAGAMCVSLPKSWITWNFWVTFIARWGGPVQPPTVECLCCGGVSLIFKEGVVAERKLNHLGQACFWFEGASPFNLHYCSKCRGIWKHFPK